MRSSINTKAVQEAEHIMTRLEMVEKIREKTGVTYEEARAALEKANWDMLDAVVEIEKRHPAASAAEPVTAEPAAAAGEASTGKRKTRTAKSGDVGNKIASVLRWIGALIRRGEGTHLEVTYRDEPVMELSVIILVLLFLINWWIPAILIVAGLFTGYKFRVTAKGAAGRIVNSVSEKASAAADEFVNKIAEDEEADEE